MAADASILQHVNADPKIDVAHAMRIAMTTHRKGLWSQISEMLRLRFGPGKLQPAEYYYYRLYDDRKYSFDDKRRFLGKLTWNRVYRQCNALSWWGLAHDKLAFYALLRGQNLPCPANRALYHPFRQLGEGISLASAEALAACLRQGMPYPVFAKPVAGIRSVGVAALHAYDRATDSLRLHDGRPVPVDRYVLEIGRYFHQGYLFQELVAPHPKLARLCGDRLSTVRLIVGIASGGPALMHALWKIPVGTNPADNFWRAGNLLAALEPASGRVARIVCGAGPGQTEVEQHPDTGEHLLGTVLPEWGGMIDLCLGAAAMLPALRLQAWDVALTDRGPMLIEVNIGGDFNLPQLALEAGIMDARFRALVDGGTGSAGQAAPAPAA